MEVYGSYCPKCGRRGLLIGQYKSKRYAFCPLGGDQRTNTHTLIELEDITESAEELEEHNGQDSRA